MQTATEITRTTTETALTPSGTSSRRVLRKTLNDALTIAGKAVQLDADGDYARSVECYQQSVDLLDHGITLMRLQPERPGRDTSHEIAQLQQIVSILHLGSPIIFIICLPCLVLF